MQKMNTMLERIREAEKRETKKGDGAPENKAAETPEVNGDEAGTSVNVADGGEADTAEAEASTARRGGRRARK